MGSIRMHYWLFGLEKYGNDSTHSRKNGPDPSTVSLQVLWSCLTQGHKVGNGAFRWMWRCPYIWCVNNQGFQKNSTGTLRSAVQLTNVALLASYLMIVFTTKLNLVQIWIMLLNIFITSWKQYTQISYSSLRHFHVIPKRPHLFYYGFPDCQQWKDLTFSEKKITVYFQAPYLHFKDL